jgi:hypothetical protein
MTDRRNFLKSLAGAAAGLSISNSVFGKEQGSD